MLACFCRTANSNHSQPFFHRRCRIKALNLIQVDRIDAQRHLGQDGAVAVLLEFLAWQRYERTLLAQCRSAAYPQVRFG